MKAGLLALALLSVSYCDAQAREQRGSVHNYAPSTLSRNEIVRDRSGSTIGRNQIDREGNTTFRDRSGNKTGTADLESGRMVYRDRFGNKVGSVR